MKEDFDHLLWTAKAARQTPEWASYAGYAELRGKGLRQQSLDRLSAFLDETTAWSDAERLAFTRWLLPQTRRSILLMPEPLKTKLIEPVVCQWNSQHPDDAQAELWLGLLYLGDPEAHVERDLELDPKCVQARQKLVQWNLGDVDYNQHHLPAFYIHDPRQDLRKLDAVILLTTGYDGEAWALAAIQEAEELRGSALAWLRDHPAPGDFATP